MPYNETGQIVLFTPRERMRDSLVAGLLQCNYRIIGTCSPYLAVIHITKSNPRCVIVDIPKNNTKGFLIVASMLKSERAKNTPVIIMLPPEPEKFIDRLKVEYLGKTDMSGNVYTLIYPFNFANLVEKIQEVI
jgi:PleD family two-component response regulator